MEGKDVRNLTDSQSFTIQDYEEKLGIVEEVLNTGIEVFISFIEE